MMRPSARDRWTAAASWRSLAALVAALLVSGSWQRLEAETRGWRVDRGDVRVVCPLTVGGSFEAKTTALVGSVSRESTGSPTFAGSFTVDLRTIDTGIDLRNEHLRRKYLEVDRGSEFDKAVVSDIRLETVNPEALEGRAGFSGTLLLHGVRKTITGQVVIRRSPAGMFAEASFPVTLADHGIPKPQYLGVGVKGQVHITVTFQTVPLNDRDSSPPLGGTTTP